MRRVCIAVVALVAALVGADGRADDVQDEFKASQGTWELVYFERDGKQVELQGRTQAIITGETFVVKRGDEIIAAGRRQNQLVGSDTMQQEFATAGRWLEFSPDDQSLVSVGDERTAIVWDIATLSRR